MKIAAAILMAVLVAGCQTTKPPPAVSTSTIRAACGAIRPWDAGWQARLSAYLRTLPRDHIAWELAKDAIDARDAIRICRGERK